MSKPQNQYSIICKYFQSKYNKHSFIVNGYNDKYPKKYNAESFEICKKMYNLKEKYELKNPKRIHFSTKTNSYFISFSIHKKLEDNIIIKNLEKFNYYNVKFELFIYEDYLCIHIVDIKLIGKKESKKNLIKVEL